MLTVLLDASQYHSPGKTNVFLLPAGTPLPPGLSVAADGGLVVRGEMIPAGHNTIYPTVRWVWDEIQRAIDNLGWQPLGKH
jgi:hypothetical protein